MNLFKTLGQSLDGADRALLVLSLVGAVGLGVVLSNERWIQGLFLEKPAGEPIGKILSSTKDTRRRMAKSMAWYSLQSQDGIYEKDSIVTGPNATASLQLGEGQSIQLNPNTFVVVQTSGGEVAVDIRLGAVTAQVSPQKSLTVIRDGQAKRVVTKKATPVVLSTTSTGSLNVLDTAGAPAAEVEVIDKIAEPLEAPVQKLTLPDPVPEPEPVPEVLATPNAPAILKPKQAQVLNYEPNVDPRSPASLSKGIQNPPSMTWQPTDGAKEYLIQVDANKNFTSPKEYRTTTNSFRWRDASPGQYYWRVKGVNEEGAGSEFSPHGTLNLRVEKPALKLPDIPSETVKDKSQLMAPAVASVTWEPVPWASAYELSVNDQVQKVEGLGAEISFVPEKENVVKVVALDQSGRKISSYTEEKVKFERNLHVGVPKVQFPEDKVTVVAFDKAKIDPMFFSWSKVSGAEAYELQFAKDPSFANPILEKAIKSPQFVLKENLAKGSIYWRVRARAGKYRSSWSPARTYEIQTQ